MISASDVNSFGNVLDERWFLSVIVNPIDTQLTFMTSAHRVHITYREEGEEVHRCRTRTIHREAKCVMKTTGEFLPLVTVEQGNVRWKEDRLCGR